MDIHNILCKNCGIDYNRLSQVCPDCGDINLYHNPNYKEMTNRFGTVLVDTGIVPYSTDEIHELMRTFSYISTNQGLYIPPIEGNPFYSSPVSEDTTSMQANANNYAIGIDPYTLDRVPTGYVITERLTTEPVYDHTGTIVAHRDQYGHLHSHNNPVRLHYNTRVT